jgi:LysM repeat protein
MEKNMGKMRFLILISLSIVLVLSACTRSASSEEPGPTATQIEDPFDSVYSKSATEEAISAMTEEAKDNLESQETPETTEVVATATPTEGLNVATATPTQDTAEQYPTATPGLPNKYTLHKGEFPYCIARRFNIDIDQLLALNGLSKFGVYDEGLTLKIPQNPKAFSGERALLSHPAEYKVVAGDSFYSIACKFGDVSPDMLAQANGKKVHAKLNSGSTIKVP